MRLRHALRALKAGTVARPGERPAAALRGRRLLVARVAWLAAVLLVLGVFVPAALLGFEERREVCTDLAEVCTERQLPTPDTARQLQTLGLTLTDYAAFGLATKLVSAVVGCALGLLIFARRPADPLALLTSLFLIAFTTVDDVAMAALAGAHPAWAPLVHAVLFLGIVSMILFFYLFPSGRFVPRWARWLVLAYGALFALSNFFPASPLDLEIWPAELQLPLIACLYASFLLAQVCRYLWVSTAAERQQTKWVVFGTALAMVGAIGGVALIASAPVPFATIASAPVLLATISSEYFRLTFLLIPLSVGVAVLRHRLFDIDVIINRALVYGTLTVGIVGFYVLVVGSLGALLHAGGNLAISLVATGVVAVLFQPVRDWLQRGANRLLYGQRDEPYAVISRLGRRLEETLAPEAVLPTIVETVREALRLPYAAVALRQGGELVTAAAAGAPVPEPLRLPLTYQQEPVGELLLAPRSPGEAFGQADRRLLDDLARQAGVAAHAVQLTTDLRRSRERLVTAREEERRRLRRDLHDGLGPMLGGLTLKLDVADDLVQGDPAAARALLRTLKAQAQTAIADIRRLVYALRPPALDDLGLVGALRAEAAQHEPGGPRVAVEAPEHLPPLPAAVEVAVYRIAQEALTNVARHAEARSCTIRLTVGDGALDLEIADDGRGLAPNRGRGVGLASMRERAEELGGSCLVESAPGRGTRVRATLPLAGAPDDRDRVPTQPAQMSSVP